MARHERFAFKSPDELLAKAGELGIETGAATGRDFRATSVTRAATPLSFKRRVR